MPVDKFWIKYWTVTAIVAATSLPITIGNVATQVMVDSQFQKVLEFAVSDTSPVTAADRFETAAQFLEKHDLAEGSVCVWVESPACNIGEFHRKLNESIETLRGVENADELTKSNALIRIRESFVTTDSKGAEQVNAPSIVTPIQFGRSNLKLATLAVWWGWVGSFGVAAAVALFVTAWKDSNKF